MRGYLIRIKPNGSDGSQYPILKPCLIGNDSQCDIRLHGLQEVKCQITFRANGAVVVENFSTDDPVKVNGTAVRKSVVLHNHDVLDFGTSIFRWSSAAAGFRTPKSSTLYTATSSKTSTPKIKKLPKRLINTDSKIPLSKTMSDKKPKLEVPQARNSPLRPKKALWTVEALKSGGKPPKTPVPEKVISSAIKKTSPNGKRKSLHNGNSTPAVLKATKLTADSTDKKKKSLLTKIHKSNIPRFQPVIKKKRSLSASDIKPSKLPKDTNKTPSKMSVKKILMPTPEPNIIVQKSFTEPKKRLSRSARKGNADVEVLSNQENIGAFASKPKKQRRSSSSFEAKETVQWTDPEESVPVSKTPKRSKSVVFDESFQEANVTAKESDISGVFALNSPKANEKTGTALNSPKANEKTEAALNSVHEFLSPRRSVRSSKGRTSVFSAYESPSVASLKARNVEVTEVSKTVSNDSSEVFISASQNGATVAASTSSDTIADSVVFDSSVLETNVKPPEGSESIEDESIASTPKPGRSGNETETSFESPMSIIRNFLGLGKKRKRQSASSPDSSQNESIPDKSASTDNTESPFKTPLKANSKKRPRSPDTERSSKRPKTHLSDTPMIENPDVHQSLQAPGKEKTPKNNLSDVEGVKRLLRTPKSPKNNGLSDLKGVKRLLKTPTADRSPQNDLTDVAGVKQMFASPKKAQKSPENDLTSHIGGVKDLFGSKKKIKSPKNELTDFGGVKKLFGSTKKQKSPKNDLSDLAGVRDLFETRTKQKSPRNDLTNVAGVKKLFNSNKKQKPPKNDLSNFGGVRDLFEPKTKQKSPKNDLTDVKGVKKLFESEKRLKSPKNDLGDVGGVARLMETPGRRKEPTNALDDMRGVRDLFRSNEPNNDLSDVEGVSNLFPSPRQGPSGYNVYTVLRQPVSPPKYALFEDPETEEKFDTLLEKPPVKTYSRKSVGGTPKKMQASLDNLPSVDEGWVEKWVEEQRLSTSKEAPKDSEYSGEDNDSHFVSDEIDENSMSSASQSSTVLKIRELEMKLKAQMSAQKESASVTPQDAAPRRTRRQKADQNIKNVQVNTRSLRGRPNREHVTPEPPIGDIPSVSGSKVFVEPIMEPVQAKKRGRKPKVVEPKEEEPQVASTSRPKRGRKPKIDRSLSQESQETLQAKKRGRKPKVDEPKEEETQVTSTSSPSQEPHETKPLQAKKRGRKPKVDEPKEEETQVETTSSPSIESHETIIVPSSSRNQSKRQEKPIEESQKKTYTRKRKIEATETSNSEKPPEVEQNDSKHDRSSLSPVVVLEREITSPKRTRRGQKLNKMREEYEIPELVKSARKSSTSTPARNTRLRSRKVEGNETPNATAVEKGPKRGRKRIAKSPTKETTASDDDVASKEKEKQEDASKEVAKPKRGKRKAEEEAVAPQESKVSPKRKTTRSRKAAEPVVGAVELSPRKTRSTKR